MTGYKSKRAAAQDKLDDDDTQVYQDDALTIAYQSGYYDGKKAAQPAQEPVGCFVKAEHGDYPILHWHKPYVAKVGDNLYTTPPQPAQEPVAKFDEVWDSIDWDKWRMEPIREVVKMIHSKTTPPQRPWVGLTDKDRMQILDATEGDERGFVMKLVEDTLRSKNT